MPIELGDSWFSPKCIEVQPQTLSFGGRALDGLGGLSLTKPNQTTNAKRSKAGSEPVGDKLHGQKGNNPDHRLRSRSVR
jgi:hypothetical protein